MDSLMNYLGSLERFVIWYSSILTWHSYASYLVLSIDFCVLLTSSLHVILHVIEMTHWSTSTMQTNLVNVNLITNINKSLKTLLDTNLTKFCTTVHASINGFDDTLIHISNMAMLSMEPRKQIITLYNNYYLTSYTISCRHITWHSTYDKDWKLSGHSLS